MFDATTARLIREAPALRGVNPQTLPQELTAIYAELTALRLRADDLTAQPQRLLVLERLKRLAVVYEALVDTGAQGDARRASAFVAGTAHQILGRVMAGMYSAELNLLSAIAIHPNIAAPLLLLVAEQNADAREAARSLQGLRAGDLIRDALVETIYDLALERLEEILQRAVRLQDRVVTLDDDSDVAIERALYGLCWAGIVHLAANLLNRDVPELSFKRFESPQATFDEVVRLSISEIPLPGFAQPLLSTFSGPRHLARLLRHVADGLTGSGIVSLPTPGGADPQFWGDWLRHRSRTKPILWKNHRNALAHGMLEQGQSAVLVLPTGAGKTTLSELKIAAALARGQKVIFLVPTLALVDQLRDDLSETFPSDFADEVSSDGDLMGLVIGPDLQSVEVMTPERCLALMSHAPEAVADVGLVVFDECHLLSPQGGGTRSLDAMLCLLHVLKHAPNSDLLLLSAMLSNAEELAAWITEVSGRPCQAFHDPWKPSRQARGIVAYERRRLNQIRQAALAAARAPRQGGRAPRVDRSVTPYALFGLHQNWNPGAEADIRLIKLSDHPVPLGISQSNYPTPNANKVATSLASQAVVAGLKTMVFVQQADHAPKTAGKIANDLEPIAALLPAEHALWQSVIAELGGEQYSLINPRSAALPHNGDMIPAERRLAESLFRRPDGANVIVATPTLAQGMNLPAQLVILAGDKRHDAEGRAPLEAHEILNAAGRAGRAGHLANGVVLLIPDPVAAFSQAAQPEPNALAKLASVLPPNDQCVLLEDPVTTLLDKIQNGHLNDVGVRYFVSRVRPAEGTAEAAAEALQIVQRSFGGFRARRAHQEQAFNQKIEALRGILAAEREIHPEMAVIAASSGFSDGPLVAIEASLTANINALPTSIVAWSDWLVDFLQQDRASYNALIGNNAGDALYVMRGKKSGPAPTAEEFQWLKVGLRAWLTGRPLCDVERALGVDEDDIEYCPRSRDLALKVANRNLYLILAAVAEAARVVLARNPAIAFQPAILETLPIAFRKGLDTPDKVAFAAIQTQLRSRVVIHQAFARQLGDPVDLLGRDFAAIKDHVSMRLAFPR